MRQLALLLAALVAVHGAYVVGGAPRLISAQQRCYAKPSISRAQHYLLDVQPAGEFDAIRPATQMELLQATFARGFRAYRTILARTDATLLVGLITAALAFVFFPRLEAIILSLLPSPAGRRTYGAPTTDGL